MNRSATLHLISGLPCAGKTTYAQRLKEDRDAVHVCLDRWLMTAYGRYRVDSVGMAEHVRRVYACRELIWSAAVEFLGREADVILDDGFFLRADRRHHVERARAVGAAAVIHFIDTPPDVLRARLAARNANPGDSHFEIAPDALETFAVAFEPPGVDEGAELILVRGVPERSEP